MRLICSIKLSAQTRLLRAGMYALSVAISFWVSLASHWLL